MNYMKREEKISFMKAKLEEGWRDWQIMEYMDLWKAAEQLYKDNFQDE